MAQKREKNWQITAYFSREKYHKKSQNILQSPNLPYSNKYLLQGYYSMKMMFFKINSRNSHKSP